SVTSRWQQSCALSAGVALSLSFSCGQQQVGRSKPSIRQRSIASAGRLTSSKSAGASPAIFCHRVNRREITRLKGPSSGMTCQIGPEIASIWSVRQQREVRETEVEGDRRGVGAHDVE